MRHAKVQKRVTPADKIYNNLMVAKLINGIMKDGKKTVAQARVYNSFTLLAKDEKDPMETFEKALQNIGPKIEVKARRIGGANFQVPTEVRSERRSSLALRWLIDAARKRPSKEYRTFEEKLAAEISAAANNEGEAVRKRDLAMRQADANRAFAHFRW